MSSEILIYKNELNLIKNNFKHLEILQWLHNNRTEGCTNLAIHLANDGDHLDIVQWLRLKDVQERLSGFLYKNKLNESKWMDVYLKLSDSKYNERPK